jgi:hypothetical protein
LEDIMVYRLTVLKDCAGYFCQIRAEGTELRLAGPAEEIFAVSVEIKEGDTAKKLIALAEEEGHRRGIKEITGVY